MSFTISKVAGKPKVEAPEIGDIKRQQLIDPNASLVAQVTCAEPVDCTVIGARLVSKEVPLGVAAMPKVPSKNHVNLEFAPAAWKDRSDLRLELLEGGNAIETLALGLRSALPTRAEQQTGGTSPFQTSVSSLLTVDCSSLIRRAVDAIGPHAYSEVANVARFVVAANGNVFLRPPPMVDEDDSVEVTVVGASPLLQALKVRRTSAFRVPGVLNIVGANDNLPEFATRKAAKDTIPGCALLTVSLGDFQPGRGEVTLSAITTSGDQTTGVLEFGVHTLYSGAFALGAIHTWLRNPTFGLVAGREKGDSIISATADASPRTLYVLTYSPFLWGKRDLEKPETDFVTLRRLNPMFGIVLNDLSNNFVAGATYDLMSTVYLSGGLHLGRVHVLNPDAGFHVGDPFSGNSTQVPVATEWRAGGFVGLSLDLRAATQFFNKALGAGGAK